MIINYDVFLDTGELIDNVNFSSHISPEKARRILIIEDGFPPNIILDRGVQSAVRKTSDK